MVMPAMQEKLASQDMWAYSDLSALYTGGMPDHGNQRAAWDSGQRFDLPNPEYR